MSKIPNASVGALKLLGLDNMKTANAVSSLGASAAGHAGHWARGLIPLGGAAIGAALAPDGEGMQGAALGLGAGMMMHQALPGGSKLPMAATAPKPAGTPAVAPTPQPAPVQTEMKLPGVGPKPAPKVGIVDRVQKFVGGNKPAPAAAPQPGPVFRQGDGQQSLDFSKQQGPAPVAAGPQQSLNFGNTPNLTANNQQHFIPDNAKPPATVPQQGDLFGQQVKKSAELYQMKTAGVQLGLSIPGTPLSVGFKGDDSRERGPGMTKWVPRKTMERALQGTYDEGLDQTALMDEAAGHGEYSSPLIGAAAGMAAAHKWLPQGGAVSKILGGLGGAAVGAGYHEYQRKGNTEDMQQALRGVYHQPEKRPLIAGQGHHTAREPQPILLSRSQME